MNNHVLQDLTRHSYTPSIMMDIDHFKKINDTHGHDLGDKVFQEVAMILQKTVRTSDPIGKNSKADRYGGEEFLIVVPETNLTVAMGVAERIRTIIEAIAIDAINITCSLGVSSLIDDNNCVENTIKRADTALYAAKAAGRNCCKNCSPGE